MGTVAYTITETENMAEVDEEELAYYRDLCERLRACRRAKEYAGGMTPPTTEKQILAVEAKLGCPLPPLRRKISLEVVDGGPGIIDDWEAITASERLHQTTCRSGWRLHPCTERTSIAALSIFVCPLRCLA